MVKAIRCFAKAIRSGTIEFPKAIGALDQIRKMKK